MVKKANKERGEISGTCGMRVATVTLSGLGLGHLGES